jgi:uncharacterized phage protein (TIGR02218 family)
VSKTIPIALATNFGSGAPTPAHALRVTRQDGQVFGFTSASRSVTIGGVLYDSAQGLDASAIVASAGLDTDNLELTTLDDGSLFTHPDVVGGVWQGAAFLIFRYSWADPAAGTEPVMAGTFGNVSLRQGSIVVELRGLQQYLQQPVGNVTSKTCRARFADYPRPNGNNRCGLNVADHTEAVTVGAVTSRRQFAIVRSGGAPAIPDAALDEGLAVFTGGDNDGITAKIRTYAGAVVVLATDLPHLPVTGDTLNVINGCRKRLDEDCAARFSNARRFQGEPHRPSIDSLTASPEPAA